MPIPDLFIASLLLQNGGLTALFPGFQQRAPATPNEPTTARPSTPPTALQPSLPSPIKRHSVTTDQFGELYEIDNKDVALLKEIGFKPGDLTDSTLDKDLKEAGFTIFSWKRVHLANLRFKADLVAGNFDT